ncbi:MEF2-activating motif and SAP domain-containing transcriptional regulator isoform X2 [Rhinatrema bivittatum]|uniref:MEF2-activating motif and SAP domain-containing transcriptional regulator isoform X2 n=1 Tax=Rhinatrema bivittatum TaxID=194408 RepID=UPI001129D71E|nr:MEF2-activating motif and SAP domain-containing transcriptional regulator isoform X2 [Rhinatrema bivittatum]
MTLLASERSMLIRSKFRSALNKPHTAFPEQSGNLGQSRTDFLKYKGQNRPHKVGPSKIHFSDDLPADCEEKEKKCRLAEDLSVKILHRPGPLELVKKNILPLDSGIKDAVKDQMQLPSSSSDVFSFDDDGTSCSSSSTSPDQGFPPSPGPMRYPSPTSSSPGLQLDLPRIPEASRQMAVSGSETSALAANRPMGSLPVQAGVALPKVSAKASEAGKPPRQKKPKDMKPKVKKLKYHQYIPPDQKVEKSPVAMDTAYSRLLQQQQIFLQLQILNQQQQQQTFCVQTVHPLTTSLSAEQVISFAGSATAASSTINLSPSAATTATTPTSPVPSKPELLPAKLDDLTVSELRQQLRKRGLPVSGTKPALLERLKPYQIPCSKPPPAPISGASLITPMLEVPTFPAPLVSDGSLPTLCTFQTVPSPAAGELALPDGMGAPAEVKEVALLAFQEDQALQEKQKVIENLTWKLKQEQKQAEDLRVELEMHQRLKNRHRAGEQLAPGTARSTDFGNLSPSSPTATESRFLYPLPGDAPEEPRPGTHSSDNFVVLCPPSCEFIRPDFELPQKITASPTSSGAGARSLEEELQEAIQKAQLIPSQSIEDILEEPLVCTEALVPTDTILVEPPSAEKPHRELSPCHQQATPPKRARHNSSTHLPPPPPPTSLPLLPPQATILEFPTSGPYDFLSSQDGLSTVFPLDHLELPLSPDRPQSNVGSSSRVTFDPVDWLETLTSGLTSGFGPSSPVETSIFSTDFIDSLDFTVNRMIDQWSTC